ncbi:unnamed protein product [Prunus armeniaca]
MNITVGRKSLPQIGAFTKSTSYTQRVLKESVPPIFQSTEAFQTTMVGSKRARTKTTVTAHSGTAETLLPPQWAGAVPVLQQPPSAASAFPQLLLAASTSQQPPVAAHTLPQPLKAIEQPVGKFNIN